MQPGTNSKEIIEDLIGQFEQNTELQLGVEDNLARSFAKVASVKKGKILSQEEMTKIIDDLFACESPFISPSGHKTFMTMELEEITKYFTRK